MADRFLSRRNNRDRRAQSDVERAIGQLRQDVPDLSSSYSPSGAVGTVWSGSAPTTIGEALDRIAAAVASGTSGAIA